MTRQCLYCAKEIPRSSASNFCSKECWTEYKKLKAMNVGADKQATVLLKKSDFSDPGDTAPAKTPPPPTSEQYSEQDKEIEILKEKIGSLEISLNEKFDELSRTVSSPDDAPVSKEFTEHDSSKIDAKIEDLTIRISKLEIDFEKLDQFANAAAKFDDRLSALEQIEKEKPAGTDSTPPPAKKGFFGKLFG